MKLQLHVWGPAFNLPSIEAQCLATIAYCSLVLPKDSWELIASSDPSVSPTGELPALRDGSVWVSRFRNIVDYLRKCSNGDWNLDRDLSESDKADNTAFSSFVESRGQPLLDLSLYVSSQNYNLNTSPAYGTLLQWPNQWILPPKLHSAAKARTEHLGLSSLDLQAMEEERQRKQSAAVATGQIPKNFIQSPRETVTGLLGRTAQQNHFRIDALTSEFFEPLEAMLGQKSYLLANQTDSPASLDCIALGYLSLSHIPDLSQPWLHEAMRAKAPLLSAYTERMRRRCFGQVPAEVAHAFAPQTAPSSLPWCAPGRLSVAAVGSTLLATLADSTPFLREVRMNKRLKQEVESDTGLNEMERQAVSMFADFGTKDMYVSILTVVAGTAALVGYMFHTGLVTVSTQSEVYEEEYDEEQEADALEMLNPGQAGDFLGNLGNASIF
ncbi:Mitochondrial outer membrane transport complexTom37/metaxin [Penicillium lividum]|nr:Mitochondrial outer membrane transport complexTom37/metaxin [Penicillium lividum]